MYEQVKLLLWSARVSITVPVCKSLTDTISKVRVLLDDYRLVVTTYCIDD